jgi:hypothetical protein
MRLLAHLPVAIMVALLLVGVIAHSWTFTYVALAFGVVCGLGFQLYGRRQQPAGCGAGVHVGGAEADVEASGAPAAAYAPAAPAAMTSCPGGACGTPGRGTEVVAPCGAKRTG